MTLQTYSTAAEARAALKAAIAGHRNWPTLRQDKGILSTGGLSMDQLRAVAEMLGIDPSQYRKGQPVQGRPVHAGAQPETPETPETSETPETDPQPETPEPAPMAIDDLLGPFQGSPLADAIRKAISDAEMRGEHKGRALAQPEIDTARAEGFREGQNQTAASLPPSAEGSETTEIAPAVFPISQAGTEIAGRLFDLPRHRALKSIQIPTFAPSPRTPTVDPAYQWDAETLADILAARGPVLIYGPRGTGKSSLAAQYAARTGRPFFRINFTRSTEAADLIGMTVPTATGTIWRDGALAHAIRHEGAVILLDEPSIAQPGAMAVLHSVLEPRGRIDVHEDGGRTVHCAPGIQWFLADNTDLYEDPTGMYAGTGAQNAALIDRMSASIEIGYMRPAAESAVIQTVTGAPAALAEHLVSVAKISRDQCKQGEITIPIGTRGLLDLATLLIADRPVSRSWEVAIVNKAPPDDRPTLIQIAAAHLSESEIRTALNPPPSRGAKPAAAPEFPDAVPTATTPRGQRAQADFEPI